LEAVKKKEKGGKKWKIKAQALLKSLCLFY